MIKRVSLIVHFRSPKVLKQLGKMTEIYYYTKKNKYAVIYVNADEKDRYIEEIKKIKLVKYIEESLIDEELLTRTEHK